MKYKYYILILVLVLIVIHKAHSQSGLREGYIVTNDNDTIYGFISNRGYYNNTKECFFKKEIGSSFIKYLPFEIKGYRIVGNKYYTSKKIRIENEDRQIFAEFLVEGIANLYYYRDNSRKERYYIEKKDENIVELTNEKKEFSENGIRYQRNSNSYISVLKYTFRDCPTILAEVDKATLNRKSLCIIVEKYHDCVCDDKVCINYLEQIPRPKFTYGFTLGLSHTKMNFINGTEGQSDYSRSIPFGGFINITTPLENERLSVQLEMIYENIHFGESTFINSTTQNYDYYGQTNFGNYSLYSLVSFDYKSICFPAFFKFEYPLRKITPIVGIGVTNSFFFNSKVNRSTYIQYEQSIEPFSNSTLQLKPYALGYLLDLGLELKLSKTRKIDFKARINGYKNTITDDSILNLYRIKSFTLSAGITL